MCSRMKFLSGIPAVFLLLHIAAAQKLANDTIYLVTLNSQPVGGSTETLCVHVNPLRPIFSLLVNLEFGSTRQTLLSERFINMEYYQCKQFQVPEVRAETEASVTVLISGPKTSFNKTSMILIKPGNEMVIMQTDKPIYKPGQTVKFRIASLYPSFLTYNQMFPTIELQDPNGNRIGQWLNSSTVNGLIDLLYPTNPESPLGFYVITAWNKNNDVFTQTFELKDYVLPKFEVTVKLPDVITIVDASATLNICAKYTYGKPVSGSVKATVCRNKYPWLREETMDTDICIKFTQTTDATGCISRVLDLTKFSLTKTNYEDMIQVTCDVEEFATGIIISGSGAVYVTSELIRLSFENSASVFKVGMNFDGVVKAEDQNSKPLINRLLYLKITYGDNAVSERTLTTDINGLAKFSLDTQMWGNSSVTLQARYYKSEEQPPYDPNVRLPIIPQAYLWLQSFISNSNSFLTLVPSADPFSCEQVATVTAKYLIHSSTLRASQQSLPIFYMVMSKGRVVQQGRLIIYVNARREENRGTVTLILNSIKTLPPVAQVLLYAILPSGEAIADSMDFPIENCLPNKVSLSFSSAQELPAGKTKLTLKAQPGSLCSVRAIDQSLLLLQPEKELNAEAVFSLLPVQVLSGYPYNIDDERTYCVDTPPVDPLPVPILLPRVRRSKFFFPYGSQSDVYGVFKNMAMKILTNADIKKPMSCYYGPFWDVRREPGVVFNFAVPAVAKENSVSGASAAEQPVTIVRKFFPETWIWDLVPVGDSGMMAVDETLPDTITKWQAGAFCTSSVGFGVAPKVELTAFQPFFVSLTLPSSVIRKEMFTLKATVFNYLQGCMAVNVDLAPSPLFGARPCKGCIYSSCLCADQSYTFSWIITANVVGEASINVTAAAVQSSTLCGRNDITVPQKGRIDTVINTLLVQAEGTKQTTSYNELICSSGGAVEVPVSLSLPELYVEGSVTAWVSVLGDIMGRALNNLASLLQMPYGCGEQNMLLFAPNIYILRYLESSGQLTEAIRSKAETFLIGGYQRELTYKHDDGSYSAFGMSDKSGNTWLTAFVMKAFAGAKRYIFIDDLYINQARIWLGQQQQDNGCFASVGQLFHTDMKGGVDDEVTLTAYIMSAMLELGLNLTDPVVGKALKCIRSATPQLTSTYALALLSYTFTLAGDQSSRSSVISQLNSIAIISDGTRHWSRQNTGTVDSLEVEMTSYVLLTLLTGPTLPGYDISYTSSIVRWLAKQQNAFGGFASTQDTVVALEALAKYSAATYRPSGSMAVRVTSPLGKTKDFTVNQSNRLLYQESALQEVQGKYKVKATGSGCVYVQFTLHYNIPPPADDSSFSIKASTKGNCSIPIPTVQVTVTVRFNGNRKKTNMMVIDLKPLSGFSLVSDSVLKVTESSDGNVKRVDQKDGHVIVYLDYLIQGADRTYTLVIQQDVAVQNLQPAVVKVYDYYETVAEAVTEYTSPC